MMKGILFNLEGVNDVVAKVETLNALITEQIENLKRNTVNRKDVWESKYQKCFDEHMEKQLLPFLESVNSSIKKCNDHLSTQAINYEKIDKMRV